jgi:hypothetical protein
MVGTHNIFVCVYFLSRHSLPSAAGSRVVTFLQFFAEVFEVGRGALRNSIKFIEGIALGIDRSFDAEIAASFASKTMAPQQSALVSSTSLSRSTTSHVVGPFLSALFGSGFGGSALFQQLPNHPWLHASVSPSARLTSRRDQGTAVDRVQSEIMAVRWVWRQILVAKSWLFALQNQTRHWIDIMQDSPVWEEIYDLLWRPDFLSSLLELIDSIMSLPTDFNKENMGKLTHALVQSILSKPFTRAWLVDSPWLGFSLLRILLDIRVGEVVQSTLTQPVCFSETSMYCFVATSNMNSSFLVVIFSA